MEENKKVRKRKPSGNSKHGPMRDVHGHGCKVFLKAVLSAGGIASVFVVVWWVFWGAFWINSIVRLHPVLGWLSPILVWISVFSPTLAVVIYVKFFYKDKDKKKGGWHPGKSAFDATVEAQT